MAKAKKKKARKAVKGKKKGKAPRAAKPKRKPAAKRKKVTAKPKRKAPAKKKPAATAVPGTAKLKEELAQWQLLHGRLQEQIRAKDSTISMQMQEITGLKRSLEDLEPPTRQ